MTKDKAKNVAKGTLLLFAFYFAGVVVVKIFTILTVWVWRLI